jgi:hypothetical protein
MVIASRGATVKDAEAGGGWLARERLVASLDIRARRSSPVAFFTGPLVGTRVGSAALDLRAPQYSPACSFDQFVGGRKERFRHPYAEQFGGLKVDGEIEFDRLHHR